MRFALLLLACPVAIPVVAQRPFNDSDFAVAERAVAANSARLDSHADAIDSLEKRIKELEQLLGMNAAGSLKPEVPAMLASVNAVPVGWVCDGVTCRPAASSTSSVTTALYPAVATWEGVGYTEPECDSLTCDMCWGSNGIGPQLGLSPPACIGGNCRRGSRSRRGWYPGKLLGF